MERPADQIIVIFGASGDLTKRKLLPSLYLLYKTGRTPEKFAILGVGRTAYTDESYREFINSQIRTFIREDETDEALLADFIAKLYYETMDPSKEEEYQNLVSKLGELTPLIDNKQNYLYYLATPPSLYTYIPTYLNAVELTHEHGENATRRVIVEKPFGYNLSSALKLNKVFNAAFHEHQIFRIDHFLGKETVQNILALRFANGIFEPLWNRNYVDYVEITAVENLGIEDRGGYYDTSGALRDMVQNHLIQLVALTAMEPPALFESESFRNEIVKIYQSLKPIPESQVTSNVVRGQYIASISGKTPIKGYREEKSIAPQSRTETFIAMKVFIDNWRWGGVPFYIRTGKQMPTKVSEIVVHFKKTPHMLFKGSEYSSAPNRLIIRIQPNEGISLKFGLKVPGSNFNIQQVAMDFAYDSLGGVPSGDAYAKLIEDCMLGENTLFTRSDAVEASWNYFDPILKLWNARTDIPLYGYPAGTWGPLESNLIMEKGHTWINPCKNLTKTDLYCEL